MLIDRLIRYLVPRGDIFFVLLEQVAVKIEAASAIFAELEASASKDAIHSVAIRIKPIETQADDLCRQIYEQLDRTFVTPIDREDLAALTKALDNVIDGMEHNAAFAILFRFDTLTPPMRQLIRITVQAANELARAVIKLRKFGDPLAVRTATIAVHSLENEADEVYRHAIGALFGDTTPPTDLIRQKDMLFSLEEGVDQCEDAMDVIRSVMVKNG
jgi:predicted phosphate transport protein (TIGR00153 family)